MGLRHSCRIGYPLAALAHFPLLEQFLILQRHLISSEQNGANLRPEALAFPALKPIVDGFPPAELRGHLTTLSECCACTSRYWLEATGAHIVDQPVDRDPAGDER